jgi:hypothetical protein
MYAACRSTDSVLCSGCCGVLWVTAVLPDIPAGVYSLAGALLVLAGVLGGVCGMATQQHSHTYTAYSSNFRKGLGCIDSV